MEVRSLTNDGGHGLVVGHHGLEELALDPIVIRVLAPMISECNREFGHSSKELTRFFIFFHCKLIGFILHHFIVGALNACATPVEGDNTEPCIFGQGEGPKMREIFGKDSILDDEESTLIELIVHFFSRGEVAWVMRIETFFNDSPKVSIHMF